MHSQNKDLSNTSSFIVGVMFLFIIVSLSLVPAIVQKMNRPEELLPRTSKWQVIAQSTERSVWSDSDGYSAEHVSISPTSNGLDVVLQPTELTTREAFYNDGVITKTVFKLSVKVNTPTACHNGLVFRGNANGEYYLFLVSSTSTYTVEILQRDSGIDLPREAIIPNTLVSSVIGQPRDLVVIGKGATYYFYINSVYMNQITDSRLNGNRVGLEAFT